MAEGALPKAVQTARWRAIRGQPGNQACAECASPSVDWMVLEYGVLVCIRCAGAHRSLGSHISKVRSIELDEFTDSELLWAAAMGNAKSNRIFEAALPTRIRRPAPDATDTVRRQWLIAKYDEQRFVEGVVLADPPPHERCSGWLQKRADVMPVWRARFFAIRADGRLHYFSDSSMTAHSCRGSFPLAGCAVEEDASDALQFKLVIQHRTKGTRSLRLMATSQSDAARWIWAFYQAGPSAAPSVPPMEASSRASTAGAPAAASAGLEGDNVERYKRHVLDLKGAGRDRSSSDYAAFERERSAAQLAHIREPLPAGAAVRVVCVRHGMGHHNDGYETASFMNRDAELNVVGLKQAERTGRMLRSTGLLDALDTFVVISPMRRTLQTAIALFGSDAWELPTVVQPLAAETSLASRFTAPGLAKKIVANVQQGDHGSTPDALRLLFPSDKHPQFDFGPVDDYCRLMGERWSPGGADDGRWWHHGSEIGYENCAADAEARAAALRLWLAQEAAARGTKTILLVSHGGILKLAFSTRAFANAEFRCFELSPQGEVLAPLHSGRDTSIDRATVPPPPHEVGLESLSAR